VNGILDKIAQKNRAVEIKAKTQGSRWKADVAASFLNHGSSSPLKSIGIYTSFIYQEW